MGNTTSIVETVLGKSLINGIYRTKVPIALCGNNRDNSIRFAEWTDRPQPMNPTVGNYRIKLPVGVEFKIVEVNKSICFENGTSIQLVGKILGDVEMNDDCEMIIANPVLLSGERDKWSGKWMSHVMKVKPMVFPLKDKSVSICCSSFFPADPYKYPIDFDIPRSHKLEYLEKKMI